MSEKQVLGVILPHAMYTLRTLKLNLRVNDAFLRTARRRGLKIYYISNRAFVLGADWIDYVREHARCSDSANAAANV